MTRLPHIVVDFIHPPIPLRQFDYLAYYAGEEDEQMATGSGRTAAEAVVDLLENHPRGIWCEQERRCEDCIYFFTKWERCHDGSDCSQDRCALHHTATTGNGWCDQHGFDGEHNMCRTLPTPPKPVEEEMVF